MSHPNPLVNPTIVHPTHLVNPTIVHPIHLVNPAIVHPIHLVNPVIVRPIHLVNPTTIHPSLINPTAIHPVPLNNLIAILLLLPLALNRAPLSIQNLVVSLTMTLLFPGLDLIVNVRTTAKDRLRLGFAKRVSRR